MTGPTQDPLPGMPEPPAPPTSRKAGVRWSLARLARNPMCTACVAKALADRTWGKPQVAAYRRVETTANASTETWLCPEHAEEQRLIDGRDLPKRQS